MVSLKNQLKAGSVTQRRGPMVVGSGVCASHPKAGCLLRMLIGHNPAVGQWFSSGFKCISTGAVQWQANSHK